GAPDRRPEAPARPVGLQGDRRRVVQRQRVLQRLPAEAHAMNRRLTLSAVVVALAGLANPALPVRAAAPATPAGVALAPICGQAAERAADQQGRYSITVQGANFNP